MTESNPLVEEFENTKSKVCAELAAFVEKVRLLAQGAEDHHAPGSIVCGYIRYIADSVDLTRHAISQIAFLSFDEWYEEHYGLPKSTRMFLRFGMAEMKQRAADAVTKALGGDDGS